MQINQHKHVNKDFYVKVSSIFTTLSKHMNDFKSSFLIAFQPFQSSLKHFSQNKNNRQFITNKQVNCFYQKINKQITLLSFPSKKSHFKAIFYQNNQDKIIINYLNNMGGPKTAIDNPKLREKSENFTDYTHASQRSYKFTPSSIIKQLNLDIFKITPCNITIKHNHKMCINYHNQKDRRRAGNFYTRTMCQYVQKGQKCPSGDSCSQCHSPVEKQYHPQNYRKCFCTHWPNSISSCPYRDFCAYAHCEQQIQAKLIHNYIEDEDFYMFYYKTEFCILNLTQHEKDKCVYAHNWQDYRRDPSVYSYEPITCINWKMKEMIYDYLCGCQNGAGCNMCHGWKEQPYHPMCYKINKCLDKECRKGSCPNYHSEKERRVIEEDLTSKYFKFVPKNRITEGVFKDAISKTGFIPKPQYKEVRSMIYKKEESQSKNVISKTVIAQKNCHLSKQKIHSQMKWLSNKGEVQSDLEDSEQSNGSKQLAETSQKMQKLEIQEYVDKILD